MKNSTVLERKENDMTSHEFKSHTLSVYVANKPGVLARIAQVFARRAFNIDSLVVSPAVDGQYSRMTITASGVAEGLQQIIMQVNKLVDVIHCFDHTGQDVVVKEMALVKLAVDVELRTELLQIAEHFGCKTVDLTSSSMMLLAVGNWDKIDAFVDMLSGYEIIELVRTGKVVMARGSERT